MATSPLRKHFIIWQGIYLLVAAVAFTAPVRADFFHHQYREQTGETITTMDWSLTWKDQVTVHALSKGNSFVNICKRAGETLSWTMEGNGKKVEAQRKQDTIVLTGINDKVPFHHIFTIDDNPWYQPLSFSLRNLATSGDDKVEKFWMIRPDTLEPVKLKARVTGQENISIENQTFKAIRVQVRVDGLFAAFWQGTYWFRVSDGLFLRYLSRHGPPGSPETEITLLL